jgi:hypothetical protein
MTDPSRAQAELDAILHDMEREGNDWRRTGRRLRRAVDCLLTAAALPVAVLPRPHTVEVPPVSPALADQLVAHHLALAASYFEASSPGLDLALAAARGAQDPPALCREADLAWLRELRRAYARVEGEDSAD